MPDHPATLSPQKTRKHSSDEINRAMARFSLLVQILSELRAAEVPFPGDDDIRHGCERALTAILSELARIDPAPPGKPCKAEETAQAWLSHPVPPGLIDPDMLQRMQIFIDRILRPGSQHN
jgi:hypothetical protein